MNSNLHKIDASGRILGRLATEIALLLRGKHRPNFLPYLDKGDKVLVINVNEIKVTGKKSEQKKYRHHTGYMGGLKEIPFASLFKRDPREVLKRAVYGMLPKNKMRDKLIKRLTFKNL